jgi:hypothetical protein
MRIIFIILMTLKAGLALSFEGLISGIGITEENFNQIVPTSMEYAVADLALGDSDGVVKSFYKVPNTSKLYSVTSNTGVYLTNFDTREVLGNWPLTPWPNTVRMKGEGIHWDVRPYLSAEAGGGYKSIEDPKIMALDTTTEYKLSPFIQTTGCLASQPLRFGDIDGNGSNELVLFLDEDLIVFSPNQQKIIFAMSFSESDEISASEVKNWFVGREGVTAQYIAKSGTDIRINARFPATRSSAKIFIDDFDNDSKKDIVVWRKLYESNLETNSVLGFSKVSDLFVHYRLVDGEYQLQTNNPAVDGEFPADPAQQSEIQGWLTSKNLTWQSGFPSKSECAGQEGQLIPEMHDPLLNDPDVLK